MAVLYMLQLSKILLNFMLNIEDEKSFLLKACSTNCINQQVSPVSFLEMQEILIPDQRPDLLNQNRILITCPGYLYAH